MQKLCDALTSDVLVHCDSETGEVFWTLNALEAVALLVAVPAGLASAGWLARCWFL